MKLVTSSTDNQYLHTMLQRLESSGIPCYISNEDTNRIIPIGIAQASLWVYLDEQYDEAKALLNDPNYEVQNGVDLEEFYQVANNVSEDKSRLNRALWGLFIKSIFLLVTIFLLIKLFDDYLS